MTDIQTILCPIDFSPLSDCNLGLAIEMCQRFGARLIIHHNYETRPPGLLSVGWMWSEDHQTETEAQNGSIEKQFSDLFSTIPVGIAYEAKITHGPLEETVLSVAKAVGADLLTLATHGKSTSEHDSLTEQIVKHARCGVLTIGEDNAVVQSSDSSDGKILVLVDLSSESLRILDYVFDVARDQSYQIEILHVLKSLPSAHHHEADTAKALTRIMDHVPQSEIERTTIHLRVGEVAPEIIKTATELQPLFIHMGAHAKGLIRRLVFGSTTLGLLRNSDWPIWFIPEKAIKEKRRYSRVSESLLQKDR